jgi:lipid-A-disaccharide synthase
MRKRDPELRFFGIGGERLKSAGVEIRVDAHELSVVGITEAVSRLPKVFSAVNVLKAGFDREQPELLILIDFPDFNLHMAKEAKKRGIPVLYYISPQIWAWRSGRIRTIRRNVDRMAVILPFEAEYYQRRNVPATFVGHPLLDYYQEPASGPSGDPEKTQAVGLLPGSRRSEIEKNLPVMLAAAVRIHAAVPGLRFLVSVAPGIKAHWVEEWTRPYLPLMEIEPAAGEVRAVFEKSSLVLAASGTITLEAAIFGVPMIILYRVSPISYYLGRALVNVPHIGLANLISGERVVPELIQKAANPADIAREAILLLRNPERLERMREKLRAVRHLLGTPGAAERTADMALRMIS